MAITLRTVEGTELTHEQLDANFASVIYSGSISGNTLTLHYTSSAFSPSNLTLPITSASFAVSSSFATTSSMTLAISGSTNYIPMLTGSRALKNSNIYQDDQGRVGIGTTPDKSAVLHIDSNGGKAGLLLPVASTGSVDNPLKGLIIYDDDEDKIAVYTGTSWKYLATV